MIVEIYCERKKDINFSQFINEPNYQLLPQLIELVNQIEMVTYFELLDQIPGI